MAVRWSCDQSENSSALEFHLAKVSMLYSRALKDLSNTEINAAFSGVL